MPSASTQRSEDDSMGTPEEEKTYTYEDGIMKCGKDILGKLNLQKSGPRSTVIDAADGREFRISRFRGESGVAQILVDNTPKWIFDSLNGVKYGDMTLKSKEPDMHRFLTNRQFSMEILDEGQVAGTLSRDGKLLTMKTSLDADVFFIYVLNYARIVEYLEEHPNARLIVPSIYARYRRMTLGTLYGGFLIGAFAAMFTYFYTGNFTYSAVSLVIILGASTLAASLLAKRGRRVSAAGEPGEDREQPGN